MPKPITIVCGLGRSGTSLMMRMLCNGGMSVYCKDPILLETPHSVALPGYSEWLKECEGYAVKILDPARFFPPKTGYEYRFIWMNRDLKQQAKSHLKYQKEIEKLPIDKPRLRIRNYMRRNEKDSQQTLKFLQGYGMPIMQVQFENLLTIPDVETFRIAHFLKDIVNLDRDKMKGVIVNRSTDCFDGFLENSYAGKKEL